MIRASDRPASTVADAQERLRDELIERLVADRPIVVLAEPGAPVPAPIAAAGEERVVRGRAAVDGPLEAIVPGRSAVVWLRAAHHGDEAAVLPVLAAAAVEGSPILVLVAHDETGAEPALDTAARLADELPGGRVLEQRATEVVTLAEAGSPGPAVEVPAGGALVTGHLVCCLPDEAAPSLSMLVEPVAATVRDEQLRALEGAVDELRAANVRLAREHLGRYDSAAVSIVHRLEERYEREREIAIENDRLYQDARRRLAQPHHVAVDRLAGAVKQVPGASGLVRLLRRLLGR